MGSTIGGLGGTAVGGPLGGAIGSTLGGAVFGDGGSGQAQNPDAMNQLQSIFKRHDPRSVDTMSTGFSGMNAGMMGSTQNPMSSGTQGMLAGVSGLAKGKGK